MAVTTSMDEKTQTILILQELGVTQFAGEDLKNLTLGELKALVKEHQEKGHSKTLKRNPMSGVPSLNREYLEEISKGFGLETSGNKDQLTLKIREFVNAFQKTPLKFGRYKDQTPDCALNDQDYMDWINREMESATGKKQTPHRDFKSLHMLHRLMTGHYQTKQQAVREQNKSEKTLKKEENPVKEEQSWPSDQAPPKEDFWKKEEMPTLQRFAAKSKASPPEKIPERFPVTRPKPEWTGKDEDWDSYSAACRQWLLETSKETPMRDSEKRAPA